MRAPTVPGSPKAVAMSSAALRIDPADQCIWRGAERIRLPPKAFAVLHELHRNAGRLVSKSELLDTVWPATFVGESALTVTIKQLRDLLGDDARNPWLIETVHRRGYRLIAEIATAADDDASETSVRTQDPQPHSPANVVGRDAAFRQLLACFEAACAGQRQLAFVTGEPGIGKTALIDAFVNSLMTATDVASALRIGRGHCVEEFGSTEAYLPLLDALDELLRPTAAEELRQVLRRCAPTWLGHFPWLQSGDSGEVVRDLQGTTREGMLRQLAAALEIASADEPLVLVLEDLHWADPSTVQFLTFLAQRRQPARLMIIASFRPVDVIVAAHPLRETKQRLLAGGLCTEVPLWFLAEADVEQYLTWRLGAAIDRQVMRLVHQRSNGNPLFMRNLIDHLIDSGAMCELDGCWHVRDPQACAEDVPTAIKQILEQAIERLDAADVAVLEAASVARGAFACAAVAHCLEITTDAVETTCERLARRGDLLRAAGTMPLIDGRVSGRYEIVHALVQNVLYQRMSAARRMATHHRWGLWAELQGVGAGELAHHFIAAGSAATADKAITYARQAAARAKAVFAYEEAVRHLEGALRIARTHRADDTGFVGSVLVDLAAAQQRAGRIVAAEATFREAAAGARTVGDGEVLARAAIGIGHGYQRLGQQDPALLELLEEALRVLGPADHPLRALALAHLDYGLGSKPGSWERRAGLSKEALELARRLGDAEVLVGVLAHTRWAFRGPQSRAEWQSDAAEVDALLERVRDSEQLLMLRALQIGDLLELGELARAELALAEFVDCAEEAQIPWFVWLATGLESKIALLSGRFSEAERLIERTRAAGERTDHPNVGVLHAGQTALLRIEQGRLEELIPLVRAGVEMFPQVTTWRAVLASLSAELGDLDDARTQLEILAPTDFSLIPRDTSWFSLTGLAATACAAIGDVSRASSLYAMMEPYRDGFTGVGASLLSLGHMGRYLGLLAATLGRRGDATAHFELAIERNRQMGAWPWLALSEFDFARVLSASRVASDQNKAKRLLDDATGIAERIGMTGWLERMRAVARC